MIRACKYMKKQKTMLKFLLQKQRANNSDYRKPFTVTHWIPLLFFSKDKIS